ncbi:MAG: response regulator transcription factor [Chthonomonadaceae bacterium]|nr:response regulator transcription factor [Chthonomonadaceae bacterium]
MTILIVDDETTLLETIERRMRREGYATFSAESAEEAMRLFKRVHPDLVILDVMLPNRSGFDFCRAVRRFSTTPIIVASARGAEEDRVRGLELGADDYVVKPINLGELAARVKAVLRRTGRAEAADDPVEVADLVIDPRKHEVTRGGSAIALSPKEFALLHFLAQHPGQVFSREALLDRVWGRDAFVTERTVDVHVRWLRTHIEPDPKTPRLLLTVRGVGYKLVG